MGAHKHGKTYIATTRHFITCRLTETRDGAVNPDEVDPSALLPLQEGLGYPIGGAKVLGPYGMPIGCPGATALIQQKHPARSSYWAPRGCRVGLKGPDTSDSFCSLCVCIV